MEILNIGISGLMLAGKDHIAKAAEFTCMGFADPMYEIAEALLGTRDKSLPGVREFLQKAGQYGWGAVNDQYPLNIERVLFVSEIRKQTGNPNFTKNYTWVDWSRYGTFGFWVNILLSRIDKIRKQEAAEAKSPLRIAVPNVRFQHEYGPLSADGSFVFVHVMCSEETRQERMAALGYKPKAGEATDVSEHFAMDLNRRALLPDAVLDSSLPKIVWNDHRPSPQPWFMTVDEFVAWTRNQEVSAEPVAA